MKRILENLRNWRDQMEYGIRPAPGACCPDRPNCDCKQSIVEQRIKQNPEKLMNKCTDYFLNKNPTF